MKRRLVSMLFLGLSLTHCGDDQPEHRTREPRQQPKPSADGSTTVPTQQTPVPQTPVISQPAKIMQTAIEQEMNNMAGPTFEGRGTGAVGGNNAGKYIASFFEAAGLQAAGNAGYLQGFSANGNSTNNIIGVIPGTDPELQNEFIVIGAHMDHLGKSGTTIYYGADDNASGTVVLMSIAKSLAAFKSLKRSLLFISFSGEELGLLGSKYYVQNPTRPLNKAVFMFNMDMVGRGQGKVQIIELTPNSQPATLLKKRDDELTDITVVEGASVGDRSDHAPFRNAGIPVGIFHTGLHDDYHKPTDTLNKIDMVTMTSIANLAQLWIMDLANAPKTLGLEAQAFRRSGLSKLELAQEGTVVGSEGMFARQLTKTWDDGLSW